MLRANPAIISNTPAATASPAPALAERRRDARQTCVAKAVLFPDGQGSTRRVWLCNISLLGVGFKTSGPFDVGQRYRMKVEAGPMRFSARVEVRDCRQRPGEAAYDIGAAFIANEIDFDSRMNIARAPSIPRNPCNHLTPRV